MAAISVAVAKGNRADAFVINDINAPIVEILRSAIETPETLLNNYSDIWNSQFSYAEGSIAHYYKVRNDFNNGDKSPANMLYLLARCVKGAVRYSNAGDFNQSPDKRRNGTSPKTLKENLFAISYYLKGRTIFKSGDYREILCDAQKGDLVYMDPPYQGVSNAKDSRYLSGIDHNDFIEAIDSLNRRGIDFIISYDGVCGNKKYGHDLPQQLNLKKVMLNAGVSSQSVLLGNKKTTYEALYISRGLWQQASENIVAPSLFRAKVAI